MSIEKDIKANWKLVQIKDVCEINPKFNRNDNNVHLDVSFIPMKAVGELSGSLNLSEKRNIEKVKKGYTYFENGDLLFAKITPCMENGKVAIADNLINGIGFGSTEFHVLRCRDILNNKFLFYFLIQNSFRNIAKRNMTGTAGQLRVPKKFIENTEIPLPPLPTQHRIVEKIEELFSELDSGVGSLKKAKEQIGLYKQSVLRAAFRGELVKREKANVIRDRAEGRGQQAEVLKAAEPGGEYGVDGSSEGWKWVSLGDISKLITKGASPRWQGFNYVNDQSQTLFITSENVRSNYLDISNPKYLEDQFNEKQKRSILKKGDVLFNIVGASIGRATIYDKNKLANINQAVSLIRVNNDIANKYITYYLNSESAKSYYMGKTVDVARANLSLKDVSSIPIPLPPLDQQHQIVAEIERRFSEAEHLEKSIDEGLAKAEALRQSILKQAFEGKLVQ